MECSAAALISSFACLTFFFLLSWPDWSNTPSSCWRRMRSVCASKYYRHWGKWWPKTEAMGRRYVPSVYLCLIIPFKLCPRFTHTWDKTLYWYLRIHPPCPTAPNLLEDIRSKSSKIKGHSELCLWSLYSTLTRKIHTYAKPRFWNHCSQGSYGSLCLVLCTANTYKYFMKNRFLIAFLLNYLIKH